MTTNTSSKGIIMISLPIIVGSMAIHLIGLADTFFLSKLGATELGAAGNATLLYYTIIMTGTGLCLGAQIIMGRRNGEGNYHKVGAIFNHTAVLLGFLSILFIAALWIFTGPVTSAINFSPDIASYTTRYMHIRQWGIPFALGNFLFIAFFVGITRTGILAIATPAMAVLNIVLDYCFIFGNWGFPALGLEGAAYASVFAEGFGLVVFLLYAFLFVDRKKYRLFESRQWETEVFLSIWKIGNPLMVQNFIAISSWFVFFTLIEQLGEKQLAASHIARAVYMMMVIPINGLGDAVNTLVSNAIGENRTAEVLKILKRAVVMCLAFDLVYFAVLHQWGEAIITWFTTDGLVILMGEQILHVISIAVFFFSTAFLTYRALAGTGATALSMRIEIFTVSAYLSAAFFLVVYFTAEVEQVWYLEFLYFSLMGGLSYYFLRKKAWHEIGV